MDCQFKRNSPDRGAFLVNFPHGFSWTPDAPKLSYRFSYRIEKTFAMTLEEAAATYGRRSVHGTPLEWVGCFINKPVKRLEMSVTFPEGYAPSYVDQWALPTIGATALFTCPQAVRSPGPWPNISLGSATLCFLPSTPCGWESGCAGSRSRALARTA